MYKAHRIFGFIIFSISAIFFVSLALSALDFGMPSKNQNIFFLFGKTLTGTYGLSSLFVPVFLAFAAAQFFSENWETKRGIQLLLSIIPFYTLVGAEKIVKNFASTGGGQSTASILMTIVAVTAAILLIAIEYIAIGIFSESASNAALDTTESDADDAAGNHGGYRSETAAPPETAAAAQNTTAQARENGMWTLVKAVKAPRPHFTAQKHVSSFPLPEVQKAQSHGTENQTPNQTENRTKSKPVGKYHITFGENDDEPVSAVCVAPSSEAASSINAPSIPIEDEAENVGTHSFSVFDADAEIVPIVSAVPIAAAAIPSSAAEITGRIEEIDEAETQSATLGRIDETESPKIGGIGGTGEKNPVANIPPLETLRQAASRPTYVFRGVYTLPSPTLLTEYPDGEYWVIDDATKKSAVMLRETLREFNIEAEVTGISKGPVITMFEILPAPGVKLSKIVALQDNIALRLAASSVRIVAPIPGKHAVGIEVPNKKRSIVSFREIISTEHEAFSKLAVPVVLGKDITGGAQIIDLAKTPHMLIAGATGAGKSVCVNSLILSVLYTRHPRDVKMILIDPKIVELKLYNDIPHLLTPVITEPKKAFQALQYALCEMERRYSLLDGMGVRDIVNYNLRIIERNIAAEKLPYIVIIIDEFADLMATTGKELETTVARLAAMSRAVGIHLVLATQRPSIDVITGLIKANIPTRIAFMVASKMDSRIIIDQVGAEKLLGRGDMLYSSAADPFPTRIQGTFVSDSEVENVAEYVKSMGEPDYIDDEIFIDEDDSAEELGVFDGDADPLYDKALEIIVQSGKASASYIQRRLKIGYNRAARLIEEMEERGIVGPAQGSKPREIIHLP
ncbi:MAG: DNA translocase FtsK [Treponemataceae bacterium]|nr:MAG: DNA translocase FtsK [Treponemataceae bacterium]